MVDDVLVHKVVLHHDVGVAWALRGNRVKDPLTNKRLADKSKHLSETFEVHLFGLTVTVFLKFAAVLCKLRLGELETTLTFHVPEMKRESGLLNLRA